MRLLLSPRNLRDALALATQFDGAAAIWRFLAGARGETTSIRLKGLDAGIVLRANSRADRSVARYVFAEKFHLPVAALPDHPTIIDLGANIGLTAAHYAATYPTARIIAVEMDAANAALARTNTAHLPNVTIVHAAIWHEPGRVTYNSAANADAFSIGSGTAGHSASVDAMTIAQLLRDFGIAHVDFLKMDIEHAEESVLAGDLGWLDQVAQINIEVHRPQYLQECIEILAAKGFRARKDTRHWSAVVGTR